MTAKPLHRALLGLIGAVLLLDLWFIVLMNRSSSNPAPTGGADRDTAALSDARTIPGVPPQLPNLPMGEEMIRGRVEDRFGAPVAGAIVELHQRDLQPGSALESYSKAPQWRTHSADLGDFYFRDVPAGSYVVRTIHEDLHALAAVALEETGPVAEPVLTLHPARMISGKLLDEKNEPIAGAWAYAAGRAGEVGAAALYRLFPSAVSGEGKFSLPLLAMDTWTVLAVVRGRPPIVSAPVPPTERTFTLTATPGAAVQGRLLLPDGTPAKRIPVEAWEASMGLERLKTATDLYGAFSWADVRPASYRLQLDSYRYVLADAQSAFIVAPEDATAQHTGPAAPARDLGAIKLLEATLLRGQVTDADTGEGVGGVVLHLLEKPAIQGRTDASGYYRLGPVLPGRYTVQLARPRGYAVPGSVSQAIDVREGIVVAAPDFRLKKGVRLWGRVLDSANAPVADANVFVSFEGSMSKDVGVRTKPDGTFLIGGFWQDTGLRLWAERMGEGSMGVGPVDVQEADVLGITLTLAAPRRGRIEGRVLQPNGGGVGGAVVHCTTPDASIRGPLETRCDAEGAFAFENLLPGTYTLDATAPDARKTAQAVPVISDGAGTIRGIALPVE
jgi:protocatechuate 3,4-dioxygenase beta subunit